VKPEINSVEVHPQLSNKGHPVDGAQGGCWFTVWPKGFDPAVLLRVGEKPKKSVMNMI
jgi:hypothetical protein